MAKNEQGLDPDENYTQEDNSFWDGTDAAHPAWWRGTDYAHQMCANWITRILDGEDNGKGTMREPFETIRCRILKLMKHNEKLQDGPKYGCDLD